MQNVYRIYVVTFLSPTNIDPYFEVGTFEITTEQMPDKVKVNVCPITQLRGGGSITSRMLNLGRRRSFPKWPFTLAVGAPRVP